MQLFLETFIPLFVAIDPFGMVPVFLGVTGGMDETRRRAVSIEAVGVALIITLGFMLLGEALFGILHISIADFRIAGGIVLLVLAIVDLLTVGRPAVHEAEMVGIVPLAMPLIAGPATLTTVLMLAARAGKLQTGISVTINYAILLLALLTSNWIARVVGVNTLRAISKLVMVLLAAIAVNFIRVGIQEVVNGR